MYTLQIDKDSGYPLAPAREEIELYDDIGGLKVLLSDILDQEINIRTQLEFELEKDEDIHNARVKALIHWRKADKNVRNRIADLKYSEVKVVYV